MRHAFPGAFFILMTLAFLGGALHEPANYDGLAYRTPRVLHWLAENQWHWIHTDFPRLNTRTAGFEWLTAPLFLLTGTDRLEFLINIICFGLLPGRIFGVLTRLGVRPPAAWHWMWLLPSGYGYVLQAGSSVNDLFGALMSLTAMEFALRAATEKKISLLWTSGLAAALMTSAKAFNIVLLLPWAIALLPALKILLRRPVATFAVGLLALGASMIPTSILNFKYCGDWTGANIEQTPIGGGHELMRLPVNLVNLATGNLAPPFFPFNQQWEARVQKILPQKIRDALAGNFEGGLARFQISELQVEETAGLGCGLSWLLLFLFFRKLRAGEFFRGRFFSKATLVPLAAFAGVGIFMIRVGIAGPARYLLPFYFLLIAPLLTGRAAGNIFSCRAWRNASFLIFGVAAMLLVVSPPRPLWPANFVLRSLDAEHSSHPWPRRAATVYSVYGNRPESFAPVIAALPPDANPLGFMAFDQPEGALWKPFGSRRILHIFHDEPPGQIRVRGIKYALVSEEFLAQHGGMKFADWLAKNRAGTLHIFNLRIHAGQEPEEWRLVQFH